MAHCPVSPSSSSVCGIFDGTPGAWGHLATHWGIRSLLIAPGLAVAGVRGKRLVLASLSGSLMVSLFLIGYTGLARAKNGDEVKKYRKNLRSGVMSTATLGGRRGLSDWYVDARDRSGVKGSIRFARRKDAEEYAQYLIGEKLVKQPPKIRRASPSRRKSAAAG